MHSQFIFGYSPPCITDGDAARILQGQTCICIHSPVYVYIYLHACIHNSFLDIHLFVSQMAMQLAFFKDANKFALTYEASVTRLFAQVRYIHVCVCIYLFCAYVCPHWRVSGLHTCACISVHVFFFIFSHMLHVCCRAARRRSVHCQSSLASSSRRCWIPRRPTPRRSTPSALQRRSTRLCTSRQCAGKESTGICLACMSCPSVLVRSLDLLSSVFFSTQYTMQSIHFLFWYTGPACFWRQMNPHAQIATCYQFLGFFHVLCSLCGADWYDHNCNCWCNESILLMSLRKSRCNISN
jgi:hypothetical protein